MDRSILVRNYKKEDIDYIIERHRVIYDKEYGFSSGLWTMLKST